MAVIIVLTPVMIAAWPAISSAIAAAAVAASYRVARETRAPKAPERPEVDLDIDNMDVVADSVSRDHAMVVEREVEGETVRVTFSCDARGKFRTWAEGNIAKEELRRIGEDVAGRVVQQYIHTRLTEELANNGFVTLAEEKGADEVIRLHVRRHQG